MVLVGLPVQVALPSNTSSVTTQFVRSTSPSFVTVTVAVLVQLDSALHTLLMVTCGLRHVKLAVSKAVVTNLMSFSGVQKQLSVAVSGSLAARLVLQLTVMGLADTHDDVPGSGFVPGGHPS